MMPNGDYHCDRCHRDFHCPKGAFGTHRKWCGWSIADRFWPKVDKRGPDECWPWMGSRKPMGYGHMIYLKRDYNAHRVSYELANGPIPEGMHVLHKCDNQPCVNPSHLFLGTHTDNMHDMDAKGRKPRGERTLRNKLTADDVRDIRATFVRRGVRRTNAAPLAAKYGVELMTIIYAAEGKTWSHIK